MNRFFWVYLIKISLFIHLGFITVISAQNLVSNYSFENFYSCPNTYGAIDTAINWTSFGETPDYFNVCGNVSFSIPSNNFGYQQSYAGNAYAGFTSISEDPYRREYIATKLIQPLMIGKTYYVSAFFCRSGGYFEWAASNNLGFKFLTDSFSYFSPYPTNNYAHVNCTTIVTDSINWTRISGSFVADSVYKYLAIGNFYDDQHTDTLDLHDSYPSIFNNAYYYVDDVCVTEDSLAECDISIYTKELDVNLDFVISPNPIRSNLEMSLPSKNCQLNIFRLDGQLMLHQFTSGFLSINTSNWNSGLYIYQITNANGSSITGKILKLN